MSNRKPRVVCAAILIDGVLVLGARHFDGLMHEQIERLNLKRGGDEPQGFIDQWGTFITRRQAFEIATNAGQIIKKSGNPDSKELFSEDIY